MGRLTDNEVSEVAEMQRHIDNLEEYLSVLFATLRGMDYDPTCLRSSRAKSDKSDSGRHNCGKNGKPSGASHSGNRCSTFL